MMRQKERKTMATIIDGKAVSAFLKDGIKRSALN